MMSIEQQETIHRMSSRELLDLKNRGVVLPPTEEQRLMQSQLGLVCVTRDQINQSRKRLEKQSA